MSDSPITNPEMKWAAPWSSVVLTTTTTTTTTTTPTKKATASYFSSYSTTTTTTTITATSTTIRGFLTPMHTTSFIDDSKFNNRVNETWLSNSWMIRGIDGYDNAEDGRVNELYYQQGWHIVRVRYQPWTCKHARSNKISNGLSVILSKVYVSVWGYLFILPNYFH
jgi:hypothetical protein